MATPCVKCGGDHLGRCTAHRSRRGPDGNLIACRQWPVKGLSVCVRHGGLSKVALEAGKRNHLRAQVMTSAMHFGVPRHVDPAEGLIQEYWLSAGLVDFYAARVTEIERAAGHEALVFGVVEQSEELDTGNPGAEQDADGSVITVPSMKRKTVRRAQPVVWLNLLNAERDRYTKLGVEIAKLGLEARRDEYIRLHVNPFVAVLDGLDLTPEQRAKAGTLLRALDTVQAGANGRTS